MNTSLASLKDTQTECYASLPRPDINREPSAFASCHSLVDVLKEAEVRKVEIPYLPHLTLLRCAWEDFRKLPDCAESNPRTEELFQVMESRIPWLVSEEGIAFEVRALGLFWDCWSNSILAYIMGCTIDFSCVRRSGIQRLPRGSISTCPLGVCSSETNYTDSVYHLP